MQWSKSFVNILLFVVFVSLVKCSSTHRVENNTAWLKKYLKEIGEKQHDETSKIKPPTQVFEESTKTLVLSSEAKRQELEMTSEDYIQTQLLLRQKNTTLTTELDLTARIIHFQKYQKRTIREKRDEIL